MTTKTRKHEMANGKVAKAPAQRSRAQRNPMSAKRVVGSMLKRRAQRKDNFVASWFQEPPRNTR